MVNLGEELQLPDARCPGDGDLGVGVHRERDHAVDVGRSQTRIVERIQHGLGCKPKLAATGALREVGRADPDDCRLSRQLARHQALLSIVCDERSREPKDKVAFAIT